VADVVDVAAGRQVHDVVGAPAGGPDQLVDLVIDAGQDGRVADVGVDLHQEVAADDHRLDFGVVDVVRDDGAAAGDLLTHELGRDEVGDGGAEVFAVADAGGGLFAAQVLADGDVFHLRRDDARPGGFGFGDRAALDALEHLMVGGVEAGGEVFARRVAVVLGLDLARVQDGGDVAAVQLPRRLYARQALLDVDGHGRVGVGAG